ncbi:MAG: hypothetical protein A3F90_02290 [Deltaproteobacteria bacterium RIFCSPLOWO2_12_FULL_60_19]|nr:MAG: hypothetical protein A3F90_02290 [Deltaproteobacteria bacterium RIFCSPLOWO2_12_FULL_60_19]
MPFNRILPLFIFLALLSSGAVEAQTEQTQPSDARSLELVDRLKEIIQRLEKSRTTEPWLLQQLRDLVRRYDWPWRARLLSNDFADSNYRLEPPWVVERGDFRIVRGVGLKTVFVPKVTSTQKKEENPTLDILGGIFRGLTEPRSESTQPSQPSAAEIRAALGITNSFALSLQIAFRGPSEGEGRFEFGPYQGRERGAGYRLGYNPGKRPVFELLRVSPGRSAVVEVSQGTLELEDGRPHSLEWRRAADGEMVVLLDGREIIRTLDRASGDDFDGFTLVNAGGEYTLGRIEIFGAVR